MTLPASLYRFFSIATPLFPKGCSSEFHCLPEFFIIIFFPFFHLPSDRSITPNTISNYWLCGLNELLYPKTNIPSLIETSSSANRANLITPSVHQFPFRPLAFPYSLDHAQAPILLLTFGWLIKETDMTEKQHIESTEESSKEEPETREDM